MELFLRIEAAVGKMVKDGDIIDVDTYGGERRQVSEGMDELYVANEELKKEVERLKKERRGVFLTRKDGETQTPEMREERWDPRGQVREVDTGRRSRKARRRLLMVGGSQVQGLRETPAQSEVWRESR